MNKVPSQNYRRQKGSVKQSTNEGPTDIRSNYIKFSSPEFVYPCLTYSRLPLTAKYTAYTKYGLCFRVLFPQK